MTRAAMAATSYLVAMVFGEPAGARIATRLRRFDQLLASALPEAELLAAFGRERVAADIGDFTRDLSLVSPDRPLSAELRCLADAGSLPGADPWHVASALILSPDPSQLTFLTRDEPQRVVAHTLGFAV